MSDDDRRITHIDLFRASHDTSDDNTALIQLIFTLVEDNNARLKRIEARIEHVLPGGKTSDLSGGKSATERELLARILPAIGGKFGSSPFRVRELFNDPA